MSRPPWHSHAGATNGDEHMGGNPVLSDWDTFILIAPMLALLIMTMFKLDERWTSPGRNRAAHRPLSEVGGILRYPSDPDGRPWRNPGFHPIQATLIKTGTPEWHSSRSGPPNGSTRKPVPRSYVVENE